MDNILAQMAQHGPWGLVCVLLIMAYARLERREKQLIAALSAEKDARIADAKAYTELALRLQDKVTTTVQQITEIYRQLPALGSKAAP